MKKIIFTIFFMLIFSFSSHAMEIVKFKDYSSHEFNPSMKQVFNIPFEILERSKIDISIYTSDGDLVRTIKVKQILDAGRHSIDWDGRDSAGIIVPNEAFIPVLKIHKPDDKMVVFDPREYGGGEEIRNLKVSITTDKNIEYVLPASARVLIRVGIKNGPMLRSLANWQPKTAGKNIQRWNGFDNDQLVDLRKNTKLSVLVSAFKLPPHTIITFGNNDLTYRQYRQMKKFSEPSVDLKNVKLVKNETRISRHYYYSRVRDIDPEVNMQISGDLKLSEENFPILNDKIKIKVDLPEKDKWIVKESLYEVGFYVDNEFISEEEQGYVPFTWIWKPVGLAPGKHLLTVNISGFRGQVGVKSLFFMIK